MDNLKTILTNCSTKLPDGTIDVMLLYDIYHNLSNPNEVLGELHRVLKSMGILSLSEHHMKENLGAFLSLSRKVR